MESTNSYWSYLLVESPTWPWSWPDSFETTHSKQSKPSNILQTSKKFSLFSKDLYVALTPYIQHHSGANSSPSTSHFPSPTIVSHSTPTSDTDTPPSIHSRHPYTPMNALLPSHLSPPLYLTSPSSPTPRTSLHYHPPPPSLAAGVP